MSERDTIDLEIERYELAESPAYRFELARRDFVKLLGGGLLVVCAIHDTPAQRESGRGGDRDMPDEIGAWLHIAEDGAVTVFTGKVEVGQDIRTSLAQAVAEELRVPVGSIRLVMGDTDLTPYDAGTFGSRTTPVMSPQLREAAASARAVLLTLAAERLGADRAALAVADGKVSHPPSKRALTFGELTKGQKLVKAIGDDAALTPAAEWKVAGTSTPKVAGRDIVTGAHRYVSDMKLPGMLHGKVVRPPAFGATLVSADLQAAQKMAGVAVVRDGDLVAVAAPSRAAASRAAEAVRAEWKTSPQPSEKELFDYLKKNPVEAQGFGGRSNHEQGSVAEGLSAAKERLEAVYTVAYIAHMPLEPRAAVAEWKGDRLTVWTGTQRPFGVRAELAEAFRIPEDRVRVIVPDTGSGYGGKHTGETAIEAARLAKAAGKPVKVTWSREEEMTWAYFRPAGVIEISSGVAADGTITAWEMHNYNSGGSGIRTPYEIAHQRIAFHPSRSPLRQGSYRGLAATANHFARESHMDDMARSVKMDPLAFRLKNLKDERLRAVFEAAANAFGWEKRPKGSGIAGGIEKGGYVASCAEVRVEEGEVRVVRVVTAFECGAVVNPDGLRNQVEGGVVQGLGGALFEAVSFENGRIVNSKLADYRVPRFSDTPVLETVIVDRKDLPSAGAGETPIVAVAPAIGNAILDATGSRLRSLPMAPSGMVRK
jgi:nicotinate dehydrogenase subunit B